MADAIINPQIKGTADFADYWSEVAYKIAEKLLIKHPGVWIKQDSLQLVQ